MSIRISCALGLIVACLVGQAPGEDQVSIRIYSTDSPVTRAANDRIEAAMRGATSCAFEKQPLKKALEEMAEKHRINLWIDEETLREVAIDLDQPITLKVSNIGLETALRRTLDPLVLTTFIDDGVLTVSSAARADEIMHTRIYPVADLAESGYAPLMKFIEESTGGKWQRIDDEGGVIQPYRKTGLLLIRQTDPCHRQIAGALTALREASKLQRSNLETGRPSQSADKPSTPAGVKSTAK